MKLFIYTYLQFKKLFLFFILLLLLYAFNLYYNMHFSWAGVALIVRMYVYVFSFFLVYNYTMEEDDYYVKYSEKYGWFGALFFIFENRIFLFFLLLVLSSVFRLTEYAGASSWPSKYLLSIFDGKSSNLVIFVLAFYIALKLMKHPVLTVTVFLGISTFYTFANMTFYDYYSNGVIVSVYKIFKMMILFVVINLSYCRKIRHYFYLVFTSVFLSFLIWAVCFSVFFLSYKKLNYPDPYFNYVGDKLIKFGYEAPIQDYIEVVRKNKNLEYLLNLNDYKKFYDINLDFTQAEWIEIFQKSAGTKYLDTVSEIILNENVKFDYSVIADSFANSGVTGKNVKELRNYVRLISKFIDDENASDFIALFINSDFQTVRLGIMVCGESGSLYFIPQLLTYLISVDNEISNSAYTALTKITGVDIAMKNNVPENSPEVYMFFKNFYLENYINPGPDK
ncbi:MAG: hypothetical protein JW982_04760 [Spirochaetes bacterium]|nr:hypothetical protein [Spirochaetota bacterium]